MELLAQRALASPPDLEPKVAAGRTIEKPLPPSEGSRETDVVEVSDAARKMFAENPEEPREWRFRREEKTGEMLFQIVESSDGTVIVQIPDEASVRRRAAYAAEIREAAPGVFSTRA